MTDVNVLFIWDVREDLKVYLNRGLSEFGNVNLIFPEDSSEENLLKLAPSADIVIGWRPTRKFLDTAERMQLFINPGVGVQHHLDNFRDLSKSRNITLANGHGNTYFTAQHAVALLLALTNKIIPHHEWMKEGLWRRGDEHAKSIPMKQLRIGLLGYGAVNSKVHRFLSGFDVEFLVCRRTWPEIDEKSPTPVKKFTSVEINQFLEESDILMVAVPQTQDTVGLISKKELDLLGPHGLIVNVARGSVIDEQSFYEALKARTIAGAGIDVWYEYRPEPDKEGRMYPFSHPFHELDNVILSPHRGASPMDDLERWDEVIENISRFAQGRRDLLNIVDLERGY